MIVKRKENKLKNKIEKKIEKNKKEKNVTDRGLGVTLIEKQN